MLARIDQDEKTFGKKFLELTDALLVLLVVVPQLELRGIVEPIEVA